MVYTFKKAEDLPIKPETYSDRQLFLVNNFLTPFFFIFVCSFIIKHNADLFYENTDDTFISKIRNSSYSRAFREKLKT